VPRVKQAVQEPQEDKDSLELLVIQGVVEVQDQPVVPE